MKSILTSAMIAMLLTTCRTSTDSTTSDASVIQKDGTRSQVTPNNSLRIPINTGARQPRIFFEAELRKQGKFVFEGADGSGGPIETEVFYGADLQNPQTLRQTPMFFLMAGGAAGEKVSIVAAFQAPPKDSREPLKFVRALNYVSANLPTIPHTICAGDPTCDSVFDFQKDVPKLTLLIKPQDYLSATPKSSVEIIAMGMFLRIHGVMKHSDNDVEAYISIQSTPDKPAYARIVPDKAIVLSIAGKTFSPATTGKDTDAKLIDDIIGQNESVEITYREARSLTLFEKEDFAKLPIKKITVPTRVDP